MGSGAKGIYQKGVRDENDSEGCQNGSRHDAAESG